MTSEMADMPQSDALATHIRRERAYLGVNRASLRQIVELLVLLGVRA